MAVYYTLIFLTVKLTLKKLPNHSNHLKIKLKRPNTFNLLLQFFLSSKIFSNYQKFLLIISPQKFKQLLNCPQTALKLLSNRSQTALPPSKTNTSVSNHHAPSFKPSSSSLKSTSTFYKQAIIYENLIIFRLKNLGFTCSFMFPPLKTTA